MEFMQQGTTITSEAYFKTLNKLHRAIQNKRCGMLTSSVVHPHTAVSTWAMLEHFISAESYLTTPYNTDLTPASTTCLSSWRPGCDHSTSTVMKSWWKVSKHGWVHRWQAYKTYSLIKGLSSGSLH
jgi:hypothetical protein